MVQFRDQETRFLEETGFLQAKVHRYGDLAEKRGKKELTNDLCSFIHYRYCDDVSEAQLARPARPRCDLFALEEGE